MKNHKYLRGLISAPHTPMNSDLSINLNAIEKQAEIYNVNNVKAVYVCGSTGEGMSMTIAERMEVAQRWCDVAQDQIDVIVNVGHTCLKDCKTLAAHSQQAGAYAISAMPPCYYKPATIADLVEFYREIGAVAPKTPFYAYHTPGLTGVKFAMADLLKIAEEQIPTLVGIKYNHNDMMDYSLCRNFANGAYDILFGVDEMLLSSLPLGTAGAIGSTYNYAAPLYYQIIEAFKNGNMEDAQKLQNKSIELVQVLLQYNVLAAGKAIMKLVGVDCGPVRLPVKNITTTNFDQLCKDLDAIDFYDFCSLNMQTT